MSYIHLRDDGVPVAPVLTREQEQEARRIGMEFCLKLPGDALVALRALSWAEGLYSEFLMGEDAE